jgi:hypothetical protein
MLGLTLTVRFGSMFCAIGITAGGTLENAQALATHESPRTTLPAGGRWIRTIGPP